VAEIPWLRELIASGYHGLRMAPDTEGSRSPGRSITERLSLWIGVLGSVITILLTAWNTQTKNAIDKRGEELKVLEVKLKERSTGIEESKERVERYKWVLSLLPSLTEKDETKRNFTLSLVRMALTKDEAEQLFAGLQQSPNQELKQVAQQGIDAIENQAVSRLVQQINAAAADDRKRAVAELEGKYKASSTAIAQVLDLYSEPRIANLSPSGLINGLHFLGNTDAREWTPTLVRTARQVLARINDRNPGPQTKEALQKVNALLATVPAQ